MNAAYYCYSCNRLSSSKNCDYCGEDIEKSLCFRYICPRCGRFYNKKSKPDTENYFCETCCCDLMEVDAETYISIMNDSRSRNNETEKVTIKKRGAYRIIHERPEFSYDAFEKFYASLTEKAKENESSNSTSKPSSVSVKCPRCGSTKTSKISSLSKAVSIAAFGIFSQKRKYQWHCNNCGSDF